MGFDMQMYHSLTLRSQRSAFRLQLELLALNENDIARSFRTRAAEHWSLTHPGYPKKCFQCIYNRKKPSLGAPDT